jgi:uncharacterized membrane protein
MSSPNENKTDRKELLRQIRQQTQVWLREGASSADLASGLTYVAAEMSFQLAPNPMLAIPVMLTSISKAAGLHEERRDCDRENVVRPIDAKQVH